MKLLFQHLLLAVMLALQKCQTTEENIWSDVINVIDFADFDMESGYYSEEDLLVPKITVYRQVEDREHVIVLCESDNTFNTFYSQSFTLSVESKLEYTIRLTSSPCSDLCVFLVTVSPPASFTCTHEVHSNGEVKNLSSQTYTYGLSVLDHHEEGVSLFYICYSSFIAVGLFIMTVAVIVTTIRSKAKGLDSSASVVFQHTQTNPANSFYTFVNTDSIINLTTAVTDNDYMDA